MLPPTSPPLSPSISPSIYFPPPPSPPPTPYFPDSPTISDIFNREDNHNDDNDDDDDFFNPRRVTNKNIASSTSFGEAVAANPEKVVFFLQI